MATTDPFDDILNLEDQFYLQGYQQGQADGLQAGRIEGRSVGLSKGFDKFFESGRFYGKAVVWANRLPAGPSSTSNSLEEHGDGDEKTAAAATSETLELRLPPLSSNSRLEKNVVAVHALVEPDTLSTDNTDDAVDDFDDRVKRAQGKMKIVERIIGESVTGKESLKENSGV
jgi:hypothetical protein